MTPAVSVCIPAYNSAAHIGRTIESVLSQTFTDTELLVVDDHSIDGTPQVVAGYDDPRLQLIVNDANVGAVANWNRVVGLAKAPLVKLVCGDDVLYPNCLERQVAALEEEPRAAFVTARRDVIDSDDRVLMRGRGLTGMEQFVEPDHAKRMAARAGTNPFGEPFCVLMRRDAMEHAGAFRDRGYVIDLDYWLRLLDFGGLVAIPESLGAFRGVGTSWSRRIGRDQSAQTISLLRELRATDPSSVSSGDLRRGVVAARTQMLARLVLYRALRL